MKLTKKSLFIIFFSVILGIFILIPGGETKVSPYYSGEAVNYNNRIIFGTINTKSLELFALEGNKIIRKKIIYSPDPARPSFFDLTFNIENGNLYVYLVNGDLYKYRIGYDYTINLDQKIRDNSYDFFYGLNKQDNKIMTVGTNGVRVWNNNMQVINNYAVSLKNKKSLALTNSNNYLVNVEGGILKVIDGIYRNTVYLSQLKTKNETDRNIFLDNTQNNFYIVDDSSLKKYNYNQLVNEFKHISNVGYDVSGIPGKPYLYFSDGIGIVKIRKSDLKPSKWVYTTKLGLENSWAMGLRAIESAEGEKLIVFNSGNILALDSNLNLIDSYLASSDSYVATTGQNESVEKLYLKLDLFKAAPRAIINLNGGGFAQGEDLKIDFGGTLIYIKSDQNGQFKQKLTVPVLEPGWVSIKVDGLKSKSTYSTSFQIL